MVNNCTPIKMKTLKKVKDYVCGFVLSVLFIWVGYLLCRLAWEGLVCKDSPVYGDLLIIVVGPASIALIGLGLYIVYMYFRDIYLLIRRKLSYGDYIKGTREILERSKTEKEVYTTLVSGKEFVVYPNVFSPKYFNDTELFADNLPIQEGEELLEIGPGTGVISILMTYKGAKKVLAVDINPDAVKNTQANIVLHNVGDKVEVRQGDLYVPLRPDEKFDTIFWNTPFGFVEDKEIPDLEKAVYDPQYKSTEKFIKEAKLHLKENGRILIGFSTTLGRLDLLQKFTTEAGLTLELIYEVASEEVHPVKFEIFEAK